MKNDPALKKMDQLFCEIESSWNGLLHDVRQMAVDTSGWTNEAAAQVSLQMQRARDVGDSAVRLYQSMPVGQRNSPEFRRRHAAVESVIREILAVLAELERSAQHARDQLAPAISNEVQAMRMRRAYST